MGETLMIPPEKRNFEGFGEGPAIEQGGLLDPADTPDGTLPDMDPATKNRIRFEMQTLWPMWRFVDVFLSTKLVMRAIKK